MDLSALFDRLYHHPHRRHPGGRSRPLKLSELRDSAYHDIDTQKATDDALAKAKAADDAAIAKAKGSAEAFAVAIKAKGGEVIDPTVTPPALFRSTDGQTFIRSTPGSIDDDAPDEAATLPPAPASVDPSMSPVAPFVPADPAGPGPEAPETGFPPAA